jgi:hypothetical protein
MGKQVYSPELEGPIELRDPHIAALLAWLVPGLGHIYQRRTGKGLLFMVCILSTFFYGLFIGQGRVVYASWRPETRRLHYLLQVCTGIPAFPALIQAVAARPMYPNINPEKLPFGTFMAPPTLSDLDDLQRRLHRFFELGSIYTMIAGLLNVLVIYDAWGGPAYYEEHARQRKPEPNGNGEKPAPVA